MKKDDVSTGDQSQGSNDVTSLADGHRNNRTLDVTNEVSNERNSDSPVDHGWAWIVVLGSFGVFAIAVGILKSFGVLLVELSRRYDAPASLLSSSQSLCSYLHLSVGTISNALSVRFGHRRVVFIGGVVAAIGLISTAFVRSIEWFFVTYGLITGLGLGMCLSPSLVFFGMFFKRHLALANGLASAGSGFGSFVFPYLMLYLLDEYSIEGCMLILGGITFNICVFAALFRPISFWSKRLIHKPSANVDKIESPSDYAEREHCIHHVDIKSNINEERIISSSSPCIYREIRKTSPFTLKSQKHKSNSDTHVPTSMLYTSIESLPAFSASSGKQIDGSKDDIKVREDGKAHSEVSKLGLTEEPNFSRYSVGIILCFIRSSFFVYGDSISGRRIWIQ
ncbi:hypothetical protein FSP39_024831 [Pinctada imbricata]|uniref:Uncharacterized protein n=1 Tax=Pinctada imbricata TaxID=66713 RepID=A0AA88Y2C6_PINIB|nr:hypothetical protein FSP39_024831 [Pinctada imbricata]